LVATIKQNDLNTEVFFY